MFSPSTPESSMVAIPLSELVPEFRTDLLGTRLTSGWDEQRLQSTVAQYYGFLGPFLSARIECQRNDEGVETDWLVVEFKPPEDRDLQAGERSFEAALDEANAGNVSGAKKTFERLVEEFPEIAKYHCALGHARLETGDTQGAEDELLRTLSLDHKDLEALIMLGNLYMLKQDPEQAARLYEASLKLDRNVVNLTNFGGALGEMGSLDRAIQTFKQALILDPSYSKAHDGLRLATEMKGDSPA